MSQQISHVYDYTIDAYKQDFGIDPTDNREVCRRLQAAAVEAMAQYRGRMIEDRPIEIIVPYAYVVDVLRPQSLMRTLSRDQFKQLIND